jgi:uncharacterized protein (TIGR02594 family)
MTLAPSIPVWITLALAEVGTKEIRGDEDNPRIKEYIGATGAGANQHDETPWCSAFINFIMRNAGFPTTRRLAARSWLTWGSPCEAKPGAICILWREDKEGNKGHIGFYMRDSADGKSVVLLGGNQGNKVCEHEYPKSRVLAYRWPL